MRYVLDISTLDTFASGAKQRFLTLYSELVKNNKNKDFLIIYTSFIEVKKYFNYPNVFFKKNKFDQDSYIKKLVSTIFIYFYVQSNSKKIKTIEYFTLPFFRIKSCISLFTIHDLRRIQFSNFYLKKIAYKVFFKYFLKRADNIIVVSNTIKKEIQSYFKDLKVSVIYNTINLNLFNKIQKNDLQKVKKKFHLPSKFIISVGHQETRKNYIRLIKAIKILNENKQKINLIIVGQRANETKPIKKLINDLKLNSNIKIYENLRDYELRCFYKLANLFVFPSIYEGFGIPILESMASNTPIVLSNSDVFKEITLNKYIYFDPFDPLSIATKIKYVLSNKLIQKKMINFGKKRVKTFTLDIQKKNLIKFYKNLNYN